MAQLWQSAEYSRLRQSALPDPTADEWQLNEAVEAPHTGAHMGSRIGTLHTSIGFRDLGQGRPASMTQQRKPPRSANRTPPDNSESHSTRC